MSPFREPKDRGLEISVTGSSPAGGLGHLVGLTEGPALAFPVGASIRANPHMPVALSERSSKHPKPRGCWFGRGLEPVSLTCVETVTLQADTHGKLVGGL